MQSPHSLWPSRLDPPTELGLTTLSIWIVQAIEAPCQQLKLVSKPRQNQSGSFLRLLHGSVEGGKRSGISAGLCLRHLCFRDGPMLPASHHGRSIHRVQRKSPPGVDRR